jgi:hypothetical protein
MYLLPLFARVEFESCCGCVTSFLAFPKFVSKIASATTTNALIMMSQSNGGVSGRRFIRLQPRGFEN